MTASDTTPDPSSGVLALQVAFNIHQQRLHHLGVQPPLIRTPRKLDTVDAVVVPGGREHDDVAAAHHE